METRIESTNMKKLLEYIRTLPTPTGIAHELETIRQLQKYNYKDILLDLPSFYSIGKILMSSHGDDCTCADDTNKEEIRKFVVWLQNLLLEPQIKRYFLKDLIDTFEIFVFDEHEELSLKELSLIYAFHDANVDLIKVDNNKISVEVELLDMKNNKQYIFEFTFINCKNIIIEGDFPDKCLNHFGSILKYDFSKNKFKIFVEISDYKKNEEMYLSLEFQYDNFFYKKLNQPHF
ncbi:MAG: hypothetical protein LBJ88_01220 [Campylobacteraceae bacterium]|jgi:hypothetical protein|nr:hypothetical protein [Campylobacteraceae bacterium]